MSVAENVRKVLQDFLAPALRQIRGQLAAIDEIHRIRHDYLGAAPRTNSAVLRLRETHLRPGSIEKSLPEDSTISARVYLENLDSS
jgi:hypothetical protein